MHKDKASENDACCMWDTLPDMFNHWFSGLAPAFHERFRLLLQPTHNLDFSSSSSTPNKQAQDTSFDTKRPYLSTLVFGCRYNVCHANTSGSVGHRKHSGGSQGPREVTAENYRATQTFRRRVRLKLYTATQFWIISISINVGESAKHHSPIIHDDRLTWIFPVFF